MVDIHKNKFESILNDISSSYKLLIISIDNLKKLEEESLQDLKDEDKLCQDILHYLEIEDYQKGDYPKFGKMLKDNRKMRRDAKDTKESIQKFFDLMAWKDLDFKKNILQNDLVKILKFKPNWKCERTYEYKILDVPNNIKKDD